MTLSTTPDRKNELHTIADSASQEFATTHADREQGLRLSREIVRNSANSIRATHRGEFDQARKLLKTVAELAGEAIALRKQQPRVYYGGYIEDALKEYTEAAVTLALIESRPMPTADELGIGAAPYLGGLADTVGELRRFILDALRTDDFSRCEELLDVMDEIYTVLVTMDYPDAVTRGLRRSTDMVRGILERTRGDLTVALRQRRLEERLAEARERFD